MECKEALQQMTAYLQGELTTKEEMELIRHVDTCENCFEELELNYIMQVGLDKLEAEQSSSMDFTAMLGRFLDKSRKRYKREKWIEKCTFGGFFMAAFLIAGLVSYILFFLS